MDEKKYEKQSFYTQELANQKAQKYKISAELIIVLLLALTIPVTVILVNQKQDIRQEAAEVVLQPTPTITPTPSPQVCGDSLCSTFENADSCPQDCQFQQIAP